MKFLRYSKVLLLALSLSLAVTVLRADTILVNGDFSQGKAHWKGDAKDAASGDMTDISTSMSDQGASSGMMVQLKPNDWTYVSQDFNTRETTLVFSMAYKTSSDFSLANGNGGDGSIGGIEAILERLVGFPLQRKDISIHKGAALVVVSDPSQNLVIYAASKLSSGADQQKSAVKIDGLMAHEDKTFFLAFPPGQGTITFQNIALTKPDAANPAPDNPFQN